MESRDTFTVDDDFCKKTVFFFFGSRNSLITTVTSEVRLGLSPDRSGKAVGGVRGSREGRPAGRRRGSTYGVGGLPSGRNQDR